MLQIGNLITWKEYAQHKFVVIIDVIAFVNIPVVSCKTLFHLPLDDGVGDSHTCVANQNEFQIVIYRISFAREKKKSPLKRAPNVALSL